MITQTFAGHNKEGKLFEVTFQTEDKITKQMLYKLQEKAKKALLDVGVFSNIFIDWEGKIFNVEKTRKEMVIIV